MIAAWMLFALVTGTALSVGALAAERVTAVSRYPRRVVWIVALTATAAGPLAAVLHSRMAGPPPARDGAPVAHGIHRLPGIAVSMLPAGETAHLVDVVLLGAWAVASAVLLVRLATTAARVRRWRRTWPATAVDGVRVRIAPDAGPAVVGLHPMDVVLPAWALALARADRALVLRHEVEHRAARDPYVLLSAALLTALVPWHVALWWQARRLRLAVELDCDARVLRADPRPAGYARLLLQIAQRRSAGALRLAPALSASPSHLERRILAMHATRRPTSPFHVFALGAAACAAIAVACTVDAPDRPTAPARARMAGTDAPGIRPAITPRSSGTAGYFEFQVERQAIPRPGATTVRYPDALRTAGISGDVLTQFVVDTTGRVDLGTVRVLRSSHPAFTAAVEAALPRWQFRPASVGGHLVKQLVQLPVRFAPPRESAAGAG